MPVYCTAIIYLLQLFCICFGHVFAFSQSFKVRPNIKRNPPKRFFRVCLIPQEIALALLTRLCASYKVASILGIAIFKLSVVVDRLPVMDCRFCADFSIFNKVLSSDFCCKDLSNFVLIC